MARLEKDLVLIHVRISRSHKDRLFHHRKRTGRDLVDLVREAVENFLSTLDVKEQESKVGKGKNIAYVPEHSKPHGLGPMPKSSTAPKSSPSPPPSPFDALKSPPFEVPEKVKRAFKNWAEFIEEADGIVDTQRRTKTIVEDIKQRVEEKDVQPCYEAFIDFLTARKDSKEKPSFSLDVPLVGDV